MKNKIEKITTELLVKLGIISDGIEESEVYGQVLYNLNIPGTDSDLLIGERGDGIKSVNLIVSRILERSIGERVRITIDINNYKKDKIDILINNAQSQADKVKELKYSVELQPANGYERMLIHSHLSNDAEIETGSIGEGFERRVVIKWVG